MDSPAVLSEPATLGALLLLIAAAAYIQTVTGFAFGLIVMGYCGLTGALTLPQAAILVSLTSLVNVAIALRGQRLSIRRDILLPMLAGMLPAMLAGYLLLEILSSESQALLRTLLGVTLIAGGILLMLKPSPYRAMSGTPSMVLFGAIGGLGGGLFSVSGPPMVFHLYRQPLPLAILKANLFALFGLSTLSRIGAAAVHGQIGEEILTIGLIAMPVVMLATVIGRRYPPAVSDTTLKRAAFALVALMGISLIV